MILSILKNAQQEDFRFLSCSNRVIRHNYVEQWKTLRVCTTPQSQQRLTYLLRDPNISIVPSKRVVIVQLREKAWNRARKSPCHQTESFPQQKKKKIEEKTKN